MDQPIKIDHESSNDASFTVPENASENIHIVLEVTDDGNPKLKRYRRLIFNVEN
ncbi:hypothetical protein [Fodinibius salsisoli]|uniref:hypothetical protein n=1 Tax=Fodinibius salsisoli TaxID=2820877 RepID=UPI0033143F3C